MEALLDRGADVNAREDALGETALMWAAAENHAEVASLVARGADVNARSKALTFQKDRFGLEGVLTILPRGNWTPLMYAAREGAVTRRARWPRPAPTSTSGIPTARRRSSARS